MPTLALSQLHIAPNRQRRFFDSDAISELADSIERVGLLHAPVVRHDKETGLYTLVAGERRVEAIKLLHSQSRTFAYEQSELPPGHLPVVYLNRLPADLIFEAELEENIRRVDLSWQEKEEAVARLHELRVSQKGEYHPTANPEGQSFKATALEAFDAPRSTDVRDALRLTEHMDDPDIAQASTRTEALKKLRDKLVVALTGELAQRAEKRTSRHTLAVMDFKDFAANNISVIVTDPPFGIDAPSFGSQSAARHTYQDSAAAWKPLMNALAAKAFSVTKAKAHIYVFCVITKWAQLGVMFAEAGWHPWHRPLIWDKINQGLVPDSNRGPRFTYDAILFASKGDRYVTGVYDDVVRVPQLPKLRRAAEKPTRLYIDLLKRSALPGDHVWDPFCGTGAIVRASETLNLTGHGTDLDPEAIKIAKATLKE